MGELIGFLVAMYLCIYLPWRANETAAVFM